MIRKLLVLLVIVLVSCENNKGLSLSHPKEVKTYTEAKNNTFFSNAFFFDNPNFDGIIISSAGCTGACSANDIYISHDGFVNYRSDVNVDKAYYTANIDKSDFNEIVKNFKQVSYFYINNYSGEKTFDKNSVSITFTKDGKIIKSIIDNSYKTPSDFVWAYLPLLYKEHKLNFTRKKIPDYLTVLVEGSFVSSKVYLYLSSSESFYLMNEIQNAEESTASFDEKFKFFVYEDSIVDYIKTDGRFYRFYLKDDTIHTFDIGYNFLTNPILAKKIQIDYYNEQNYPTF